MAVRRYGFPTGIDEPLSQFENDSGIKVHPLYHQAKSGCIQSAISLVDDLAVDFITEHRDRLSSGAIYVAPHAREATGDNAIPQVLATACAMIARGAVETEIVQVSRVFHTGADPMERLSLRPVFEGDVVAGAHYVLVDDVMSMGNTLAELSNYIQEAGGQVVSVVVLVNAGRIKQLQPQRNVIRKLEERFSYDIEKTLGIFPSALTANEAAYLIGFRSADEIRNRLAKARKETNLRLRSKGIEVEN